MNKNATVFTVQAGIAHTDHKVDRRILEGAQYPLKIEKSEYFVGDRRLKLVDLGDRFNASVSIEELLSILKEFDGMQKATEQDVLNLCYRNPELPKHFILVSTGTLFGAKNCRCGKIHPADILCVSDIGEGQFAAGLIQYMKILHRLQRTDDLMKPARFVFVQE